jgi:hypothetical protein
MGRAIKKRVLNALFLLRNPSIPRVRLMGFAIKMHLKMHSYWLYPSYKLYSFSLRTSEPMMLE